MAGTNWPPPTEGDFLIKDFHFAAGGSLSELRIHYRTLGSLRKDQNGRVCNAVLVKHGTGGNGSNFLNEIFAGELFIPGGLLDATKHFIVLSDGIGHGQSSKPSNGLHAKFPRYGYHDMVLADYKLLTEGLGVDHLRLVMGTSMGGMHTWLWGETYPDFMDALMPLASLPMQISGRNRMFRKMVLDAIRTDPDWKDGEYTTQPRQGLTTTLYVLTFMSSIPLQWQKEAPDQKSADAFLDKRIEAGLSTTDANDVLYNVDASYDYDPRSKLHLIKAPLIAVNSADDQVNPPELGILEDGIKDVAKGKAVVLPISDATRGHGSHTVAVLWKDLLKELLEISEPQ
jgi:homoserine O-acetyltransferase